MKVLKDISLKPYNTFGITANAKKLIEINSLDDLRDVTSHYKDFMILGGGSNILITKNIDKPVLHVNLKGKEIVDETEDHIFIKAQAGENWHEFVLWCLDRDYGGLENLSLIPGNVGTSPMQNIGAYGVEIKDVMSELEAFEIATGKMSVFTNSECHFGYRDSIFKNTEKGKYIITTVTFRLTKTQHVLNTNYGAIQSELEKQNINNPTIQDVSKAVISIRESKLPNPKELGNSGSFFKNPVVSKEHFLKIQETYPEMPFYPVSENEIKIPAGWLVEQCGFKGKRYGDAGVHKNQALVLVNYGNASGKKILNLSKKIQQSVLENFNIALDTEVNIV